MGSEGECHMVKKVTDFYHSEKVADDPQYMVEKTTESSNSKQQGRDKQREDPTVRAC